MQVGLSLIATPEAFGQVAKIVGFVFFAAVAAMLWWRVSQ